MNNLMKSLTVVGVMAFVLPASAQPGSTFNQGDLVFNAGIGFGTSLYSGIGYSSSMPPVSVSGEYGVVDDFITDFMTLGIGGYIGIAGSKYERIYNPGIGVTEKYGWKYNYTVIGARAVVHYPLVDKLDTYGGVMLGYNIVNVKEIGDAPIGFSSSGSTATISVYIGGRYYFNDHLAGMLELGYGVSFVNLGLAYKI